MELIIDAIFLIDFVLMFFTSIVSKGGLEVKDSIQIASTYTSTLRFYLDFFALLGSSVITNYVPQFRLFGFLKMTRVFRLKKIISMLNVSTETKSLLNLSKLIFYIFLYLHIIACQLWHVVSKNKDTVIDGLSMEWYPPNYWVNYLDNAMYDKGIFETYLLCLYYAIMIHGSNELGPVNKPEMAVMSIFLMISALLNAIVFGDVASLITSLGAE